MSEIIISLEERNVKGDTTRKNLVQAFGLLRQSLKESLGREYALFREEAEMVGIPIDELTRMQRRPVVAAYVHPFDPTKTWNGRGRRPGWVTAFFPEVSSKNTATSPNGDAGQETQDQTEERSAPKEERGGTVAKGSSGKSAHGGTTKVDAGTSPGSSATEA